MRDFLKKHFLWIAFFVFFNLDTQISIFSSVAQAQPAGYVRLPVNALIPSYSQAQEDSLKLTIVSAKYKYTTIWNSTLLSVRIWNGSAFVSADEVASSNNAYQPITISKNEISSCASAINVSSSYQPIGPGITILPSAGKYLVFFTGTFSNSSNGGQIFLSIFTGGIQSANSERTEANTAGDKMTISTNEIVSVNGSQAIEVKWKNLVITNTSTAYCRTLNILKIQ